MESPGLARRRKEAGEGVAALPCGCASAWASRAQRGLAAALVAALLLAAAHAPRSAGPPWRVAVCHSWGTAGQVLSEMGVLAHVVRRATGGTLTPTTQTCDSWLGIADDIDVVFFGPYGDRQRTIATARRLEGRAIRVFLGSEPEPDFGDSLVEHMDVALGHPRGVVHPVYLRMPWWLPYSTAPLNGTGGCRFHPLLLAVPSAAEWAVRAGDSALLSSHTKYPRPELHALLMSAGRRVDAPGRAAAFHNMEWPPELHNSHLTGKVDFLRRYRFTVCPENSRTGPNGGYATEKLPQAHMAGAVPLYWGDALDSDVWNLARVLLFNGTNGAALLAAMGALERSQEEARQWFAQPALAPTATAWLERWCDDAGALFAAAYQQLQERREKRRSEWSPWRVSRPWQ